MRKHHLSLGGAVLLWSTSFPVIKWALGFTAPGPLLAIRFLAAGLGAILLFLILRRPLPWHIFRRKELWVLGFSNALGFALQFYGQDLTSASHAALFINTYVIFVALAAPWFLSEKLNFSTALGAIMGFLGAGVVATGLSVDFLGRGGFLGDLLCVAGALSYTVYILVSKRVMDKDWDVLEVAFGVMVLTSPLTLPFILISPGSLGWSGVGVGVYLGLFCSLVPFALYIYSLKSISATASSVMLLGEVVLAVLWSFLFLSERLSGVELAGAALVLGAIFLAGKGETDSRT